MKKRNFFRNIASILCYAVFGILLERQLIDLLRYYYICHCFRWYTIFIRLARVDSKCQ